MCPVSRPNALAGVEALGPGVSATPVSSSLSSRDVRVAPGGGEERGRFEPVDSINIFCNMLSISSPADPTLSSRPPMNGVMPIGEYPSLSPWSDPCGCAPTGEPIRSIRSASGCGSPSRSNRTLFLKGVGCRRGGSVSVGLGSGDSTECFPGITGGRRLGVRNALSKDGRGWGSCRGGMRSSSPEESSESTPGGANMLGWVGWGRGGMCNVDMHDTPLSASSTLRSLPSSPC